MSSTYSNRKFCDAIYPCRYRLITTGDVFSFTIVLEPVIIGLPITGRIEAEDFS